MRKLFIKNISALVVLSSGLFAMSGPHEGLSTGYGGDNGEICVYCHTPHAGNTSLGGPVPLWNKPTSQLVTSMGDGYPMYGTTIAGTTSTVRPEAQSLACLSCHDGVSAMNAVVNAPGSGAGNLIIGSNSGLAKPMSDDLIAVGEVTGTNSGLSNDHPVSIEYIPGRGSLRPIDTPLSSYTNAYGTHEWVGASTIADLLRGDDRNMVHCSSCHDPHTNQNGTYLRQVNTGSALCFGCHDK